MRRTGRNEGPDVEDSDCSMTSCSSAEAGGSSSRLGQGQAPAESEVMRVLAVDDNNIDRKLIEMLLKTSSFTVTTVNSAKKALEVLGLSGKVSPRREKELEFDLIITDYCMPEMTGYDLLTRAKDDSSVWKDIPVVIMSSENRPRRINRCMAAGASEFLIKPVQLADVQRLKCHIREARELRAEFSSPATSSSKRKGGSTTSGRQSQGIERRTRRELTVA